VSEISRGEKKKAEETPHYPSRTLPKACFSQLGACHPTPGICVLFSRILQAETQKLPFCTPIGPCWSCLQSRLSPLQPALRGEARNLLVAHCKPLEEARPLLSALCCLCRANFSRPSPYLLLLECSARASPVLRPTGTRPASLVPSSSRTRGGGSPDEDYISLLPSLPQSTRH
jgi:hypothetical protein